MADGRNSYLPGAGLGENSRNSVDICIKSTRPSHKVTGCWKEENDGILPEEQVYIKSERQGVITEDQATEGG